MSVPSLRPTRQPVQRGYSPDYNPIELAFAKVKAQLRAAKLRTIDKIENYFGTVHDAFDPDECRGYIRHSGYNATSFL
ncbi:MAG: transposase [Planctomycetes bacterium]|nr:transposase [Planctomycetota bacterium]